MTLESTVYLLILLLNTASILILLIGVCKALYHFFINEFQALKKPKGVNIVTENNRIKQNLASYVLLSLEVLIAADIVGTILNPTLEDILMLGTIVVIRTIISYFLGKEITNPS